MDWIKWYRRNTPAISKNYYGQKTELFLDDLSNQELDNLRDHKQKRYFRGRFYKSNCKIFPLVLFYTHFKGKFFIPYKFLSRKVFILVFQFEIVIQYEEKSNYKQLSHKRRKGYTYWRKKIFRRSMKKIYNASAISDYWMTILWVRFLRIKSVRKFCWGLYYSVRI